MALTQRLDLRQTQSLVMTPQLQQAIKLLQLSNLELGAYVEAELERNPLLERADGAEGDDASMEGAPAEERAPIPADGADAAEMAESASLPADGPLDADYANVWTGGDAFEAGGPRGDSGDGFDLDQSIADRPSLREHLIAQLRLDLSDPVDRLIGLHLIGMLDEAGYLGAELDHIAAELGCPPERVAAVLKRLQRFDPPGVFARDLAECLGLQLRDRDRLDPAMQALLKHLHLLAARNLAGLRKACGVDDEDLADMAAELRTLDPKPGLAFAPPPPQAAPPDVLMRAAPEGGWRLELNPDTLPRVLVNRRYAVELGGAAQDKASRDYVAERLSAANWLTRALEQRAETVLKVASEIVRRQDGFFRRGVEGLKPLTLREVAEAIGMHESTVSRVVANKVVATPRGLHELKFFFTNAISSSTGEDAVSAEAVRRRVKVLIDAERPDRILSDDAIVEILRKDGVDIARRTVAKYREAMHIPSSVQRRREKALGL